MQITIETFLPMAYRLNLNGRMALRHFTQNIHLQTIVIAPEAEWVVSASVAQIGSHLAQYKVSIKALFSSAVGG